MQLNRVAILGGGPGGLYAARLLKLRHPQTDITVYEQTSPDQTFGFGVGLASGTQRNLARADLETLQTIESSAWWHDSSMQVGDQIASLSRIGVFGIGRSTLLRILQKQAEAIGVRMCFGTRYQANALEADLVIAADGVNSPTRESMKTELGAKVSVSKGFYLWCGAEFALEIAVFAPEHTEHGTFVTHAYPYAANRSTFLIETDPQTLRSSGLDKTTQATPWQDSDQESLSYLAGVFAKQLGGRKLIGNRTRWLQFRTVTCTSWHSGNVVLIGDAAHTAHYSIGSGTKLAMEDAIALDVCLASSSTVQEALTLYEEVRRPAVEHLQEVAKRSELWWESFPQRIHLPVDRVLVSYMTRAGKVSLTKFAETESDIVRKALTQYADADSGPVAEIDLIRWVVNQPLTHGGFHAPSRMLESTDLPLPTLKIRVDVENAWTIAADKLLSHAQSSSATAIWLTGQDHRGALLDRLDFGERVKNSTNKLVVVEGIEEYLDDLAAGLVSSRADLVYATGRQSR